jgi:predicted RNase H-related nuclease YkuK (DUF458 family)
MNVLGGLWLKVSAIFAVIIGAMFFRGKYQSNKIEDLEHENKTITKKAKITQEQAEFTARLLADEQEEILKEIGKNEEITLDDINNL